MKHSYAMKFFEEKKKLSLRVVARKEREKAKKMEARRNVLIAKQIVTNTLNMISIFSK